MGQERKYPEVPVEKLRWRCPPESLSFENHRGNPALHGDHRAGAGAEIHSSGSGAGQPGVQHFYRRAGGDRPQHDHQVPSRGNRQGRQNPGRPLLCEQFQRPRSTPLHLSAGGQGKGLQEGYGGPDRIPEEEDPPGFRKRGLPEAAAGFGGETPGTRKRHGQGLRGPGQKGRICRGPGAGRALYPSGRRPDGGRKRHASWTSLENLVDQGQFPKETFER